MKITHRNIEYEVSALGGWHSHLYPGLSIDVLKILTEDALGTKITQFKDVPGTILLSYEYFVKFCLTTTANDGVFLDYSLANRRNVAKVYKEWLVLFSGGDFYNRWLEAYLQENREENTEINQKKEQNIEAS